MGNIPLGPTGKSPPAGTNRPPLAGAGRLKSAGANHPPTLGSNPAAPSLDSGATRRAPQMRTSKNLVHARHLQHTIDYYAKSRAEHIKTYYNGTPLDDFIAKFSKSI